MIRFDHINWIANNGKHVLKDINLKIRDHSLVVITGPNGSGKTSLGKLLMGLVEPTSGNIYLNEEDITKDDVTERATKGISFGFQQPVCIKGMTIRRLLMLSAGKPISTERLEALLEQVGLDPKHYLNRELSTTLSGGEMKRIEIASILARDTDIMIFDEPEAGIDLWSFDKLVDILLRMQQQKQKIIIVISHQERILQIADEIVLVRDGRIEEHGPGPMMLSKLMAYDHQQKEEA